MVGKKVSDEALSCSQSIDNRLLKSKKSMCDISATPHSGYFFAKVRINYYFELNEEK